MVAPIANNQKYPYFWRCGPSAKPICDQQFLGEAQSSTAAY
ncbi:hypothetical protein [Cardinium endosymbiont of Dermatophagoides farinae]|nr:hypothetical protein [Cardinium endosymbiont of Dermatophagoides farinae]